VIEWRIHLSSSPERVYELLATAEGRASFWAESAPERDGDTSPLTDTANDAETRAGWVSVLLALKAAADHGVDLRNHDPARTWETGYADN
jgi:hypothetical protein